MTWRRARWGIPIVAFLGTFGVFSVRHPGSVKAALTSGKSIAMTLACVAVLAMFLFAARWRPKIYTVAPFVITAGILGGAFYAEVPFERESVENRELIAGDVVDAAPTATSAAPVPTATRHSSGELVGINHSASGAASIIESATGEWIVRFEDFTVQGSPEPVLYLLEGNDKQSPGGTNLGAFTATKGTTLDVALPAGVEPGVGWTVLIWCEKFDTPIANATQTRV